MRKRKNDFGASEAKQCSGKKGRRRKQEEGRRKKEKKERRKKKKEERRDTQGRKVFATCASSRIQMTNLPSSALPLGE